MSICQMNICAPSTLDPYVQILIPKVMILEGGGGALSTNYIRRVHGVSALIKESKPWEWASSLRRVDTARWPPMN